MASWFTSVRRDADVFYFGIEPTLMLMRDVELGKQNDFTRQCTNDETNP